MRTVKSHRTPPPVLAGKSRLNRIAALRLTPRLRQAGGAAIHTQARAGGIATKQAGPGTRQEDAAARQLQEQRALAGEVLLARQYVGLLTKSQQDLLSAISWRLSDTGGNKCLKITPGPDDTAQVLRFNLGCMSRIPLKEMTSLIVTGIHQNLTLHAALTPMLSEHVAAVRSITASSRLTTLEKARFAAAYLCNALTLETKRTVSKDFSVEDDRAYELLAEICAAVASKAASRKIASKKGA